MDPQLVNLILAQLKAHGDKLERVAEDVTSIKAALDYGNYEPRIRTLEATDWWIKAGVKVLSVSSGALLVAQKLGIL